MTDGSKAQDVDGPYEVLILEDNPSDFELMKRELRKADRAFSVAWAQNESVFREKLAGRRPDLVLADYNVPGFNAPVALELSQRTWPGVPVVIVSGAIGEEIAIETLKAGATDYVLKQRLKRLVPVAERALEEAHRRQEKQRDEKERELTAGFLRLVNDSVDLHGLVEGAVRFFQLHSGCEAVGVRLKEGEDFPYFERSGFPPRFIELENSLCTRDLDGRILHDDAGNPVIECMCGDVIYRRFDSSKPFFTPHGSFWTNSTTEILAGTAEEGRLARARIGCNGEGYESVALFPLFFGDERLGLVQLNDQRKGRFTAESIALWERLAGHLAVAVSKFRAEDALRRAHDELERRVEVRTAELTAINRELGKRSEQLARLTSELVLAEQRERRRLSQVLHDNLQQILFAAKLGLDLMAKSAPPDQAQRSEHIGQLVAESIRISRELTVELSPPILHEGGIAAGLEWLARYVEQKHGLTAELAVDPTAKTERDDLSIFLFQAARELLFNVVKHAGVSRAKLALHARDSRQIVLVVSDEGAGFTPESLFSEAQTGPGGFGLFCIRERITLLGGRMEIESAPGNGARFTLTLPRELEVKAAPAKTDPVPPARPAC